MAIGSAELNTLEPTFMKSETVITSVAGFPDDTTTVEAEKTDLAAQIQDDLVIEDDNNVHTQTAEKILAVIKPYLMTKAADAHDLWIKGSVKFISVIRKFVEKEETVKMCLPAFPFKSANKIYKVLGALPDKAEEVSLKRLNGMCEEIKEVYGPGANLLIISDGLVYNDLLTIPDREVWAYGEALRALAVKSNCTNISFSRLRDLVELPSLPSKLEEITYVANATNFRRALINKFGRPDLDVTKEIEEKEDTRLTYSGYRRFLESDLRFIFSLGENRSKTKFRKDAFAGAVKHNFPGYLRLSIHQSTGEHKISLSLLPTTTSYTTPWHCSVAFTADNSLISRPKGDLEQDSKFELVFEDGRPSYFKERVHMIQQEA
ncbi:uncharacterized protein K452DRAFT_294965 [Aplosporella prunicola CBS 121167]|uniref:Pyoverdine/dityrosine biosynthesis protein n=1 Tax=Aplosporella prunicola CBS 121167 TaxID=1176127 RepID=A0A6A6BQL0_9PEZI|nr:uncharacterized protein K452DRAFT_294965 [Aplosporella prunicola CBS 121167]KAF2146412.1 hypothetical protein K452DRAFT_294965 [Aplosporella prunicola CBS 121167]